MRQIKKKRQIKQNVGGKADQKKKHVKKASNARIKVRGEEGREYEQQMESAMAFARANDWCPLKGLGTKAKRLLTMAATAGHRQVFPRGCPAILSPCLRGSRSLTPPARRARLPKPSRSDVHRARAPPPRI
jgi:hypothetical protein